MSSSEHAIVPASRVQTAPPTLRIVHEAPAQQWSAYDTQGDGRMVPVFVMHGVHLRSSIHYRTSMASKYFGTVTTDLGDAAFTSARND